MKIIVLSVVSLLFLNIGLKADNIILECSNDKYYSFGMIIDPIYSPNETTILEENHNSWYIFNGRKNKFCQMQLSYETIDLLYCKQQNKSPKANYSLELSSGIITTTPYQTEDSVMNEEQLKQYKMINKYQCRPIQDPELIKMALMTEETQYDLMDINLKYSSDLIEKENNNILRTQFMQCWSIPIGIPFDETMVVEVLVSFNQDGTFSKPPEIVDIERMNNPKEKYYRVLAESALRALNRCENIGIKGLNTELYETWKNLQVNFDPREILQ